MPLPQSANQSVVEERVAVLYVKRAFYYKTEKGTFRPRPALGPKPWNYTPTGTAAMLQA